MLFDRFQWPLYSVVFGILKSNIVQYAWGRVKNMNLDILVAEIMAIDWNKSEDARKLLIIMISGELKVQYSFRDTSRFP